jgi:hypothetical protein
MPSRDRFAALVTPVAVRAQLPKARPRLSALQDRLALPESPELRVLLEAVDELERALHELDLTCEYQALFNGASEPYIKRIAQHQAEIDEMRAASANIKDFGRGSS